MSNSLVQIPVGGEVVGVDVPQLFTALVDALPIVVHLFGNDPNTMINANALHKKVGGSYKLGAWISRVVADCRLVEGRDFIVEELDINDPANAGELARNRGRAPVIHYFTSEAASMIVARSNSDEAFLLLKYFYWLAHAATPVLLARINKANAEALLQKNRASHYNALLQENTDNLNKLGTNSTEIANAALRSNELPKVREHLNKANGFATIAWRQASDALADLKRGKQKEAMRRLEEVNAYYGEYDDMRCDEFPWCG